jgi:hypothetical protein
MENLLPNYLTDRGVYHTDKKNLLTDEEHELLRTLKADGEPIGLSNGDWVYAISANSSNTAPCNTCYFKESCISEKGESSMNPPLYMRMCMPHKRKDGKSVRFAKVQ